MHPAKTILTVDDDTDLLGIVRTLFEREKINVLTAVSLGEMWRKLHAGKIDLILLDVMLPDGDGLEAMRELRLKTNLPVIMLTGRDTPMDRVLGLEFGADDYIGKPFEPRELLARVRSVMRRYALAETGEAHAGRTSTIAFGDYLLCTATRVLSHRRQGEIPLTSTEYELLRCLASSANRPLNRDQLMDGAFSRDWSPFDRSIDVMIGRLRKKIEKDPSNPRHIKTVRGVGYVLSGAVPADAAGERRRSSG